MQGASSTGLAELTLKFHNNINALLKATIDKHLLSELVGILKPWVSHVSTVKHKCVSACPDCVAAHEAFACCISLTLLAVMEHSDIAVD